MPHLYEASDEGLALWQLVLIKSGRDRLVERSWCTQLVDISIDVFSLFCGVLVVSPCFVSAL